MLRPSKKLLFAIEAVLDIAFHAGERPVQSRDITARQGIPRRYLEHTLQSLAHADILVGVRGPRGGYRLARERRRISLGEITRIVEGADAADQNADAPTQSALGQNVVQPLWRELRDDMLARLDATTIEDMCDRAREAGVERAGGAIDFVI